MCQEILRHVESGKNFTSLSVIKFHAQKSLWNALLQSTVELFDLLMSAATNESQYEH